MDWINLIISVLLPTAMAALFWWLTEKTGFSKFNIWVQRLVIGLCFGFVLCVAIKSGIKIGDAVVYADVSIPLTAGFVFGAFPAVICSLVGDFVIYFAGAYLGLSSFAILADMIVILLAGIFASLARHFLFEDKRPSIIYGGIIAAFTDVARMLLVFVTHINTLQDAFAFVKAIAIWSIVINALTVLLSIVVYLILTREKKNPEEGKRVTRTITQTFSVALMLCVVLSFVLSDVFTSVIQTRLRNMEIENLLSTNVADSASEIITSADRELINAACLGADRLDIADASSLDVKFSRVAPKTHTGAIYALVSYAKSSGLDFLGYLDNDANVIVTNYSSLIGTDLSDNEIIKELMVLAKTEEDPLTEIKDRVTLLSSDFVTFPNDSQAAFRFVAVAPAMRTGVLLAGVYIETYNEKVSNIVSEVASNRHIGQSGYLYILSSDTGELVSCPENTITPEEAFDVLLKIDRNNTEKVLNYTDINGIEYYYYLKDVSGYLLVGCIPVSEAVFYRDLSVYLSTFIMMLVFFLLFTLVFVLIKWLIVRNIKKVNRSLTKITAGDLSETINIRDNVEFDKLSTGINTTVNRLKELISEAEKRIDAELEIATSIQMSVLPTVSSALKERPEFDIAAHMVPAKEVGGDFYDFYLVDDSHLAFLIADVSGKGIPAAMFMMNAKSTIKGLIESGLKVNDAFTEANRKFCDANDAGMFVTAWMGILDLKTGVVKFANAGHNMPVIRHGNGEYTYLKSKPNFVLAGMDISVYRENEVVLAPGDEILLYTDGVTEATNAEIKLFGEERLLEVMNNSHCSSAEETCFTVKKAVDTYVGEAPQFDDITILSLHYNG